MMLHDILHYGMRHNIVPTSVAYLGIFHGEGGPSNFLNTLINYICTEYINMYIRCLYRYLWVQFGGGEPHRLPL